MKKFIVCTFFGLFVEISCAQLVWDKEIIPDTTGYLWSPRTYTTYQTSDRGFIVAGDIGISINSRVFYWAKLDSLGNFSWSHITGGGHNNVIWSITEQTDGSLFTCGTSYPFPGSPPF